MSIIYEALQKTQRNRQGKNDLGEVVPRRFDLFDLALIGIIISLLVAVAYLYHAHNASIAKTTAASQVTESAKASSENKPVIVDEAPAMTLNGVLVSDADKIALINNQPLHKGDTISGMKIVSIELNKVVLQQGNQVMVLRTPG